MTTMKKMGDILPRYPYYHDLNKIRGSERYDVRKKSLEKALKKEIYLRPEEINEIRYSLTNKQLRRRIRDEEFPTARSAYKRLA